MSTLETRKVEPLSGTTVTIGAAGDAIAIDASTVKTNTIKDAGGNTILTSDGSGTLSSVNSGLTGSVVYISTSTASGSSSLDITSGITSTYSEYMFVFTNINPVTNQAKFGFQANASGQSGFNESIQSCSWHSYHGEGGAGGSLSYSPATDQANGTSYQPLSYEIGNAAASSCSGILQLYAPSVTSKTTHFYARSSCRNGDGTPYAYNQFTSGHINVAAAITEISFNVSSGNFDGVVQMYGIK
tara:strand:- start:27 stop:755 length:729 start_codon:yes stop_codon:yes gene_type:complete